MLRIYGRTNSVNVQKAMWCIGELELDCERINAGMEHGKNGEEWFLALNPNGRVPLLQDGAFSLGNRTRSSATCAQSTTSAASVRRRLRLARTRNAGWTGNYRR